MIKRIVIKGKPEFEGICNEFYILDKEVDKPVQCLFCTNKEIFKFCTEFEIAHDIYEFEEEFTDQIINFDCNFEFDNFIVTTNEAAYNYSYASRQVIDVTSDKNLTAIQNVCYNKFDKTFLFIANKLDGELGFYLL